MTTSRVRGALATLAVLATLGGMTTVAQAAPVGVVRNSFTYGGIAMPFPVNTGATSEFVAAASSADRPTGPSLVLTGGVISRVNMPMRGINTLNGVNPDTLLDLNDGGSGSTDEPNVVPVPAALWLFASAMGLLGWRARRG